GDSVRGVGRRTGGGETLRGGASALPYLAPVLMVLIPAKMLRPKHVGDYWAMHGLGLLAMALACAMASEGAFILVFAAYGAAVVWSLSTLHLYRELGEELATTGRLAGGRRGGGWGGRDVGRGGRGGGRTTLLGHPADGGPVGARPHPPGPGQHRPGRRPGGPEPHRDGGREPRTGVRGVRRGHRRAAGPGSVPGPAVAGDASSALRGRPVGPEPVRRTADGRRGLDPAR